VLQGCRAQALYCRHGLLGWRPGQTQDSGDEDGIRWILLVKFRIAVSIDRQAMELRSHGEVYTQLCDCIKTNFGPAAKTGWLYAGCRRVKVGQRPGEQCRRHTRKSSWRRHCSMPSDGKIRP
jgi:hypothetical protein